MHEVQLIPVGLLLKICRVRIVYDAHEDAFPEKISNARTLGHPVLGYVFAGIAAWLELIAKCFFDRFVAATPKIGGNFPRRRTIVVQNFPSLDDVIDDRVGHPFTSPSSAEPAVLYLGNIFPNRGLGEIVRAMGRLPESLPARLVIAGKFTPPSYQGELELLEGWSRVDFRGWQDRAAVRSLMCESRCGLVLFHPRPEHLDAYPNKLFEYMAAGLPVIASDFPLWRSIVESANCGLLVDPNDPAAISDAIVELLSDPPLAAQLGSNGRAAVREKYHWEKEAKLLLELYEGL